MPTLTDLNQANVDHVESGSPGSARFSTSLESKAGLQVLVILLVAVLLCLPCLLHGIPAGTNAITHVKYQRHFSQQFWNGDRYPRWLAEENKGYGSPIFLIQYPLPYFVTALIRPVTSFPPANRESRELGLFVCLALGAAGLAAWLWLRKLTSPLAATLGAAVYMALPYVLQDGIYARTAIGELCTFIWMPVALLLCESMYQRRSAVFALSGIFALLVLSNLLSAVLFAPLLTLYAIVLGRRMEPSLYRRTALVLLAQFLGAGMAGVYLVPLVAYQRLFNVHQMDTILGGYQLALYFLDITSGNLRTRVIDIAIGGALLFAGVAAWYTWRATADLRIRICMGFALVLGALSLIPNLGHTIIRLSGFDLRPAPSSNFSATMFLGIFFTVALGFLSYCRIAERARDERGLLLLCIVGMTFFFMLPFSAPLWKAFRWSSAFQFPFRLAGMLCVAVAGLVSMAFHSCLRDAGGSWRRPSRLVIAFATIAAIAGGLLTWRMDRTFRHPKVTEFDVTQDIDPMYRTYVPLQQLPAFARDLGTAPDSYDVAAMPGDGTFRYGLTDGDCDLNVRREGSAELFVSSSCRGEAHLQIGQLYSPLWRIVPIYGAHPTSVIGMSPEGLIELTLQPGKQETRLLFDTGRPGRWGTILSGTSIVVGLVGFLFFWKRSGGSLFASATQS